MKQIAWSDFELVDIRVGTVIQVDEFPEARKKAYKIRVDFGSEIGIKQTSAQVTTLYSRDELVGRQVIAVVNFSPKQIGPFLSEFLLLGFPSSDGHVVLAIPERSVPNGLRLA